MTLTSSTVPVAEDRVLLLQQVHEELKTMIQMAGEQDKRMYDKNVKMQPTFQVGDKVLLRHDNIATIAPSKKLSTKFLGPFLVISQLSDVVYRLKLPKTLRIHNVFHVSLLERYCEDTIVGRRHTIPSLIVTPDGDLEYEVQQILDSRFFGRWKKLQYLVSWTRYGPEENSSEPASNLKNALDIVAEFHMLHLQAPQPSEETRH